MWQRYTDGEVVIMLAFQASGTGSIPVRCTKSSNSLFYHPLLTEEFISVRATPCRPVFRGEMQQDTAVSALFCLTRSSLSSQLQCSHRIPTLGVAMMLQCPAAIDMNIPNARKVVKRRKLDTHSNEDSSTTDTSLHTDDTHSPITDVTSKTCSSCHRACRRAGNVSSGMAIMISCAR